MSEKRKKYTSAEKAKIALAAIKGDLTVAQMSSKYGAHATQRGMSEVIHVPGV